MPAAFHPAASTPGRGARRILVYDARRARRTALWTPCLPHRVCIATPIVRALALTPSQLAGTSSAPSFELLKVFAYGTWSDYVGRASELPALTEAQSLKLKKLTVVALASQSKMLEYDQLMRELEVRLAAGCGECVRRGGGCTTPAHAGPRGWGL